VLMLLCATSTAVWVSASVALGKYPDVNCDARTMDCHNGLKVWAICIGVASMMACVAFLAHEAAAQYAYALSLGLSGWWLQGVAISFVPSVFAGSVNGWVCSWLSVGLAAYFASLSRNPRKLEPVASSEPADDYSPMAPPDVPQATFGCGSGMGGTNGMGSSVGGGCFEGFGGGASAPSDSAATHSTLAAPSMGMPAYGLGLPPPDDYTPFGAQPR